jgi:3-methyladenine DNA glycosylase AlkC
MNKIEYRCNRCLVIEERWLLKSNKSFNSIPCHKCEGLALRLPWSKSIDKVFDDFEKTK